MLCGLFGELKPVNRLRLMWDQGVFPVLLSVVLVCHPAKTNHPTINKTNGCLVILSIARIEIEPFWYDTLGVLCGILGGPRPVKRLRLM